MAIVLGMGMGKGSEVVVHEWEWKWDPCVRFILSGGCLTIYSAWRFWRENWSYARHRPSSLHEALHLGLRITVPLVATSNCNRSNFGLRYNGIAGQSDLPKPGQFGCLNVPPVRRQNLFAFRPAVKPPKAMSASNSPISQPWRLDGINHGPAQTFRRVYTLSLLCSQPTSIHPPSPFML